MAAIDVYAARRDNLRRLSQEAATQHDFAESLDVTDGFLSQIIGINPSRRVGEKLARQVESRLGLGYGWLDVAR
jgi:hypothetical protein